MLVSITLQTFGLLCLSLAMDKHFKSAFQMPLTKQLKFLLKFVGWFVTGLSVCCLFLFVQPVSIAIVQWMGFLSANILLVSLIHCRLALKTK